MKHEVYAYGVIASSTLYLLEGDFPARSGYAEIDKKFKNVGGEAANSALVLSRLGLSVKLDGNWINPDEDAEFLREVFNRHHVDVSRISFKKCQGPKEMLVVDANARTIFGTYGQLAKEKSWNFPEKIDVQNAEIICLDPFFGQASLQVAQYARSLKKPIVTIDCKCDDPLFLAADVAIISEEFLNFNYPDHSIPAITRTYKENARGVVIFTFGHKEILYSARDEENKTFKPFEIAPVDTTGAGDSFRAGIIYGLLKNWPIETMIEFASALAAIVCQTFPGVLNAPNYDEVISFIKKYKHNTSSNP